MAETMEPSPGGSTADDQSEVIGFLSEASSYPHAPQRVDRRETHGAIVFLAGNEAWKIKRAVRFPYMDFSTLERRRRALEHELAINRPLAPDIYLSLVAIKKSATGALSVESGGTPVEWALRMTRFDERDLLSERVKTSGLDALLCRDLADAVFEMHAKAPRAGEADTPGQMRAIAGQVTAALQSAHAELDASAILRFAGRSEEEIAANRDILVRRDLAGCVRRCHGDLHLGNIVLWKEKPVLFDAIEFDDRIATIDVLYDLAFLIMDLEHRGLRPAANIVLNRWLWRSESLLDLAGLAALPLFMSLRAGVRAMVAAERAEQVDGEGGKRTISEARTYLATALALLSPEKPMALAVGGLSGTGKSTLAAALAPHIGRAPGAVHLRSDLERKALFNAGETERLGPDAYGHDASRRVYDTLLEKAGAALRSGQSVITDAVYARTNERDAIEDVAKGCGVPFTGLWLEAPSETLMQRVEERRNDASDATRAVVAGQLGYDIGSIGWARLSSGGSPAETLAAATALIVKRQSKP
jgi:aminoglycoside phosphotransferase family enzyme/predicted kinase